jgi:hypothetical protein
LNLLAIELLCINHAITDAGMPGVGNEYFTSCSRIAGGLDLRALFLKFPIKGNVS